MSNDSRLERLDPTRCKVVNELGIDATLFATREVPVENAAVNELLGMLRLQQTVERPDNIPLSPEEGLLVVVAYAAISLVVAFWSIGRRDA